MIVSVDNRIVSAISFGVFCRCAPSTSAIIRSTKVSPGLAVISTTIRSDSTVVPAVTAERSPPDSRITGADSPVIADSSTVAMPATTSPSPGTASPASTTTRSPTRSAVPGTRSSTPSTSRRATASVLVRRNDSACARPRPSATASARLANSTVNHNHPATEMPNTSGSVTASTVVSTEPAHTTNMTGLVSWCFGFSLRRASGTEVQSWRGLKAPADIFRGAVSRADWGFSGFSRIVVTRGPPRSVRGRARAGKSGPRRG